MAGRWAPNPALRPPSVWAAQARAIAGHWRAGPSEYRRIRTERGLWTPYDAVAEHAREKAILLDQLLDPNEGPTVVVTHHPPLAECVDGYREIGAPWWAPAFYVSDFLLEILIASERRSTLWPVKGGNRQEVQFLPRRLGVAKKRAVDVGGEVVSSAVRRGR